MKNPIVFILLTAFVLGILSSGCSPQTPGMAEAIDSANVSIAVKTAIVEKRPVERIVEYSSTLVPFEEVHFSPASPGRIESLKVEIGDRVSKGSVIAVMDQTQLNQARVQLALLKTEYRRFDTLISTGSIPQQQYDQIKTQYEVAKSNYEFLNKNTHLTAPFSGIVSGKYYEEGEMYSGTPNAKIGKAAIVSLVQINPIKAIINISESYFPMVKKGMKAKATSDIYPEEVFQGEAIRIYPVVNEATRTFQVEIKIDNPQEKLRPGMFVRIHLAFGMDEALLVPSVAVLKQTGTNNRYLFVNNQNKAEMRLVKIGSLFDDYLEIREGLNEGEELVVVGQNKLSNNSALEIVK